MASRPLTLLTVLAAVLLLTSAADTTAAAAAATAPAATAAASATVLATDIAADDDEGMNDTRTVSATNPAPTATATGTATDAATSTATDAATDAATATLADVEIPVVRQDLEEREKEEEEKEKKKEEEASADAKPGRCPSRLMDPALCPDDVADQCHGDSECGGAAKCCSTGCARVCVRPMKSTCELQRENTLRRGRALGVNLNSLLLPDCKQEGDFAPIQCDGERCFCVDRHTGYELPGTRARSIELVNCSSPRPCSGYQCRMLCPYEFEMDEEGCPVCECRDPCRGVTCPGGTACTLEEAPCAAEPCPPLPTCKQPRSLATMCPLGDPLMMDEKEGRPFLCGSAPGTPQCPALYKCHVRQGHDYGVCCAAVDELQKPGQCPVEGSGTVVVGVGGEEEEMRCGASCLHDLQCPSTQKCCISEICGQHCVQPANLTACLQQRMIAELLVVTEREGKGYVPQCHEENGLYTPRQCSRNGLICWCVDPEGNKMPRTLAAAHEVDCAKVEAGAQARHSCGSEVLCSTICEYGYQLGADGCPTCECDDPCQELTCPENSTCVMRKDPGCEGDACSATPMCLTNDSDDLPAPHTTPTPATCPTGLTPFTVGGVVVECDAHAPCPADHQCTPPPTAGAPYTCCPVPTIIEASKPGQCPFVASASAELCEGPRCASDSDCGSVTKCCVVPACGPRCVTPQPPQNLTLESGLLQGPTMCEYLRDLVELEGVTLAVPTPTCDENGAYEQVQCNALGQCWCVDDFGTQIPGTKASSRELVVCDRVREALTCGEMLCRLGCDYGFVLDKDTACPLCQCRDPCQDVECSGSHVCQMVDIPCVDGVCPAIPQCVPVVEASAAPACPLGEPYTLPETNATLACSPRARALECPQGYSCFADDSTVEGVCCPSPGKKQKAGQCPFLVPVLSGHCDLECSDDSHCRGDEKCCSNGCGTQCQQPIVMTACEHQRNLLEHRAREAGIPAGRVYLPQCDDEGAFLPTQCHPATLTCWCVDTQGQEVPGTRVSQPAHPNCQEPLVCPAMNCDLACLHGYRLDGSGCPVCACRDPCEEVSCATPLEECRIVHVACVDEPCPPLPVCLPRLENPCPYGSPLRTNESVVECGPEGSTCPSSHKCHLSPLGEYALCCPKPREICYEPKDAGYCEGAIKRWYFNPESNRCESFRFGGCSGNLNNFESQGECAATCPVLTSCERMREKNLRSADKNKKLKFIPKCSKDTGAWLPEQCLEELGVCWCVTPQGDQVPGSLTRGAPQCQGAARASRRMNFDPATPTNMICEPGQTVHVCDKQLCENQVCFSHPHAVCRVNPCGGCSVQFVDAFNSPVNCEVGLTECQRELQRVLNSPIFTRPALAFAGRRFPASDDSADNRVHYDVDLYRNVDVFHFPIDQAVPVDPTSSAAPSEDTPLQAGRRGGRHMSFEESELDRSLTVSGDVVAEAQEHLRKARALPQETVPESPLEESSLVDPEDLEMHLAGPALEGSNSFGLEDDFPPPRLTLDDTFEAVPTEETPASAQGMTVQAPVCEADGGYAREQRSGGLTWCVDAKGRPIHETLTRGHVRCGPNGQILEQVSVGFVCPRGARARVCRSECLRASCHSHPDAVCVADPCNDCRVSFYSASGEKVHCEGRCSQPLAKGMCRASFKRFFYNASADQCQEFIFGGCLGNDNNFVSMEECRSECQNTDICSQPVQAGVCTGGEARWYYNVETRKCEPFLYSGCGGKREQLPLQERVRVTLPRPGAVPLLVGGEHGAPGMLPSRGLP
ncbi:balbiani ring protein 3-like [Penaeus monodon]|uniref:balbiani ring protein 3-like n=1 Tax=Penaeus monodon TaxID=6687 RepID=UPI0018A6EFD6|nr:balbiani ring protein 3-like [Penaeus monodon]